MKTIYIGRSYATAVSDIDYEFVTRWRWCFKHSARKYNRRVYARRAKSIYQDGERIKTVSIYLAHVILVERMGQPKPEGDFEADHMDGDTLNNQRDNLQWIPKAVNRSAVARSYSARVSI